MNDKVLIRKQTSGGVQQFQTIGGQAPSFMDLARRVRDPNAGRMERLRAGFGLGGKVAAGLGTVFQTAHQLQGGNALAPLGMGYTYQGLDPTAGMRNTVSEEQQIADKVQQMRINQQAKDKFAAMQQPQDAAPSTSTTDFPNQSQQLGAPYGLQDPLAEESSVVDDAAGALQAMPPPGGQAPLTENDPVAPIAQVMAQMPNMGTQPTGSAQSPSPMPLPTGHNTSQATLQPNYPSQQPQNSLQQATLAPYQGTINPATGQPYPVLRSFAMQVLDEFGDMLQKADPHVAGLLAFRVYMDKIMR